MNKWITLILAAGALSCTRPVEPEPEPLAVSLSASQRSGTAPLQVAFTSQVTGARGVTTWAWTFGDGESSPAPGPLHVFTDPGTYDVVLQVTDVDGRTASNGLTVSVGTDEIPAVAATADVTSGQAPLAVTFTCTSSSGEAPFQYVWDYSDGTVAPGPDGAHTYTTAGDFTARCIATDATGDTGSNTVAITVTPDLIPTVTALASPVSGVAPLTVDFEAFTTSGDAPLTYDWSFGDGNMSTTATPSNNFVAPGTYNVTLSVTDADGDVASDSVQVAVGVDSVPAVAIAASPLTGISPVEVQLDAVVAGGDAPLTFQWDFGDGGMSSSPSVAHEYLTLVATSFDAVVTVTDADGDQAVETVTIMVDADDVPVALTSFTQNTTLAPSQVDFLCDSVGGNAPFEFAWDFGDGVTSTLQNPSHIYTQGGDFTATCTVTDANGDEASSSVSVTIDTDTTPAVAIGGGPLSGVAPLAVDFTSVVAGGNGVLTYDWTFGDGNTSTMPSPTNTYNVAGTYGVVLSVIDEDGDVGLATIQVNVN